MVAPTLTIPKYQDINTRDSLFHHERRYYARWKYLFSAGIMAENITRHCDAKVLICFSSTHKSDAARVFRVQPILVLPLASHPLSPPPFSIPPFYFFCTLIYTHHRDAIAIAPLL
eukprot:scaffold556_cov144-Skeletonema_menzelii.AAC.3